MSQTAVIADGHSRDGSGVFGNSGMFRTGFILSPVGDMIWFLGLPILALIFAMISQAWFSTIVIASTALWFDIPHHGATFIRTFGLVEDRQRFWQQMLVGLFAIAAVVYVGLRWAPLTLAFVSTLWNHQHQLMQLHGFSRIYDFKARTGGPKTPAWDLGLACVLYGNLFLTAPLFARFWIRELHRFGFPITSAGVALTQTMSVTIAIIFLVAYGLHIAGTVRAGYGINPLKYTFIGINYLVLYIVANSTSSILVYSVANVIMHGSQYIVIVYHYVRRKAEQLGRSAGPGTWLATPGHISAFLFVLFLYAVTYQLLKGAPLDEFGFGLINVQAAYPAIPGTGIGAMSAQTGQELILLVIAGIPGKLHLYYDSFIWKVRDSQSQSGL